MYNGDGVLRAQYKYDSWGKVLSVTDENGNAITSATHVGNLNPFRYRGYYYDTESGFYYLMSRYYDPVTHRFINAYGYFQAGNDILDANMHSYCGNNPVNYSDPTGEHSSSITCGDPTCTQCRPERRDFINSHIDWYNKVTGSNILGVLDDGTFVYMVCDTPKNTYYVNTSYTNTSYYDNSIYIIDQRCNNDPNIQIVNSVAIGEFHQLEIIEMIQNYNQKYPTTNASGIKWDRSTSDMMSEWNAHNFIYTHSDFIGLFIDNAKERAQSVDFNNTDEGKYKIPVMW